MEYYEFKDIEQNYNRTMVPLNRGFLESSYMTALVDMGRTQPFSAAFPTQYPTPYQQQYFVESRIMKANLSLADSLRLANTTIDSSKEEVQQYINIIQKMLDDGVFDKPSPRSTPVPLQYGYLDNYPKPENVGQSLDDTSDETLSEEQKTLAEE